MEKPKTLDQFQAETQLAQEQHKLERLENRKKYLEQGVQVAISAEAIADCPALRLVCVTLR